jgi:hypothetical protein
MRLVGWPEEWNSEEGITPIHLSDIDLHASPEELRALARFFEKAANKVEVATRSKAAATVEITFPNPNPRAGIPLTVSVVHEQGRS